MKSSGARSSSLIRVMLLAFTTLLLVTPFISAQGRREPPSGSARPSPTGGTVPERTLQPSIRERQNKIREMELEATKVRTPEQEKLALAQIAEDFEKLQLINNKMMATTMPAAAPDYARVAETTAEIKMRANRIKDNLRLAKVPPNKEKISGYKKAQDVSGLKANLLSLDGSIMSFIKSPIFQNPSVVEVEEAEKVSQDLESIIELSNLINKDTQKLSKSSEKRP